LPLPNMSAVQMGWRDEALNSPPATVSAGAINSGRCNERSWSTPPATKSGRRNCPR
jgi:hypothetical protein